MGNVYSRHKTFFNISSSQSSRQGFFKLMWSTIVQKHGFIMLFYHLC